MNPSKCLMFFALLLSSLLLPACADKEPVTTPVVLQGRTMGTTWNVKLAIAPGQLSTEQLHSEIDVLLEQINQSMSTYRSDSELSHFNQNRSTDWQPVSRELALVIETAQSISRLTGGAFDITVGPLVNLWGFGPERTQGQVPDDLIIEKRRQHSGYSKLDVRLEPPALRKQDAEIYVDLSAIAKGYAVDRMAALLESHQALNYMVEIGGEIRVRGEKQQGRRWRIAVEKPSVTERAVHTVVSPGRGAMATSGDYRNFIEQDGKRYSHTIDPVSGRPVTHSLASVSVIHPSCMFADALATALTVLGPERGLALAKREKLAVYMIERRQQGFEIRLTDGFRAYLEED